MSGADVGNRVPACGVIVPGARGVIAPRAPVRTPQSLTLSPQDCGARPRAHHLGIECERELLRDAGGDKDRAATFTIAEEPCVHSFCSGTGMLYVAAGAVAVRTKRCTVPGDLGGEPFRGVVAACNSGPGCTHVTVSGTPGESAATSGASAGPVAPGGRHEWWEICPGVDAPLDSSSARGTSCIGGVNCGPGTAKPVVLVMS
mmetsp:Transcript_7457/g.27371  ORF Transcript_7457/g.27371 Transcript_7457/m.27371 type:complete len:202 (-) Transcript_7457:571-1176(-)